MTNFEIALLISAGMGVILSLMYIAALSYEIWSGKKIDILEDISKKIF